MKREIIPAPILTANKSNYNTLIFGKKGYGKTSFARGYVSHLKRLIILDTLQYEYDQRDGKVLEDYRELIAELKETEGGEFRYVVRSPEESPQIFRLFTLMSNTTMLVEEIDNFCDLHFIDPSLAYHMKYGRHRENNLIGLSRNAQEVSPTLRKGCDIVISFQQDEPNVLAYLAKINKPATEELPQLKKGEWKILKGREYMQEFLTMEGK